jgi:threonine synthase
MTTTHSDHPADAARTRSCVTELVCHSCQIRHPQSHPEAFCEQCGKCYDIDYDYARAKNLFKEIGMGPRPFSIWRFEELLPILDARASARVGRYAGFTPLIKADRLGAELGLKQLYVKDDSTSRPSLSYKDRVVSMAVARLLELGRDEIGCVSTGNVGTAVAALAAKAGVDAYVFYPNRLEMTKARACRALGAKVCQVEGNYDEANRRCREVAGLSGLEFANITLRPFYAEGAKTVSYEIVEQLGWRAPEHIVTAVAGGTLSSRIHKGLEELELVGLAETEHTKLHVAQPLGCAPIAEAIVAHDTKIHPCAPTTLAHSLAIGKPGDGGLVIDAVQGRGGTAGMVSDEQIFSGIDLLASTEGILTEPAGGTTVAVLKELAAAGTFDPDEVVVAMITGNGLKTLDDHPRKQWPLAECEPEAMLSVLEGFRHASGHDVAVNGTAAGHAQMRA